MDKRISSKNHSEDYHVKVTIHLIQQTFIQLLKEKPLHTISVRELCTRAGINRSTFYHHYLDIYDLNQKIEDELYENFTQAFHPAIDEGSFSSMIVDIVHCLQKNAEYYEFILGDYGDNSFAKRLLKYAYDQYEHLYSQVFETATAEMLQYYYEFASAGCIRILQKWFSEGMRLSAEEIGDMTEGIMLKGLSFWSNNN